MPSKNAKHKSTKLSAAFGDADARILPPNRQRLRSGETWKKSEGCTNNETCIGRPASGICTALFPGSQKLIIKNQADALQTRCLACRRASHLSRLFRLQACSTRTGTSYVTAQCKSCPAPPPTSIDPGGNSVHPVRVCQLPQAT